MDRRQDGMDEPPMSWTLQDLERVEAAIAKGVRVVEYSDHRVEYHSIDQLKIARTEIRRALGLDGAGRGPLVAGRIS